MQKRRNSFANVLELHRFCIELLKWKIQHYIFFCYYKLYQRLPIMVFVVSLFIFYIFWITMVFIMSNFLWAITLLFHCNLAVMPKSLLVTYISYQAIISRPQFNINMTSYQCRKSHCGDKMILWPSYLHSGISYTGKTTSFYWIGAPVLIKCSKDMFLESFSH